MEKQQDIFERISLEALFNNSLDAIVKVDKHHIITIVNKAFIDLFGFSPEQVLGKHLDDVLNMAKPGSANRNGTELVKSGHQFEEEAIRYDIKGRAIDVLIKGIPILADSKSIGSFVIYADITKRKQTERALKESELKFRDVVSTAPGAVYQFLLKNDGTFETVFMSEGAGIIFERPAKELLIREKLFDNLHPDDYDGMIASIESSAKTLNPWSYDFRIITKKNKVKWIRGISTPRKTDEGISWTGLLIDATDKKEAEQRLEAELHKYRAIIDTTRDGFWIVDLNGCFVEINKAYCEMTGYSREELLKMNVYEVEIKESAEVTARHIQRVIENGSDFFETRHQCKNGGIIDLEISVSHLKVNEGILIAFLRDITERKLAEEQMRYFSIHDSMTGLYNRYFLETEIKRLDTARQLPISMIMGDLNGLKLVNDTYGHATGDKLLKKSAEVLKQAIRDEDILARWGGDEFVILLPQTKSIEAETICKRIAEGCSSVTVEGIPISMALGTATKYKHKQNLVDKLKEAEDSLYKQKLTESRSTKNTVLRALLKTLEAKSYETEAHTRRMQSIARQIGEKLNLPDAELNRLTLLITLHDIGKINISEEILTKAGPLTDEEWVVVKKHPETGFRIARATEEFAHVAEDILAHHERWDGMGYPQGLKGSEISLLARITAVADSYEVMTNGRPYKKAMSLSEVAAEFKKCSGSQFDPELAELLLSLDIFKT